MSSLHDSGSGYGYPPIFTSIPPTLVNGGGGNLESDDNGNEDNSNGLVSTPLISARCWNNYENQNECRHLNVIGPGDGLLTSQQGNNQEDSSSSVISSPNYNNQVDDGSLITPIVIFETPQSSSQSFETTPAYSTYRKFQQLPNEQQQYNPRPHQQSTTTTTTPDYGSTILPDLSWPRVRWGPRNNASVVSIGDLTRNGPDNSNNANNNDGIIDNNNNINNGEQQQQPTKRPKFSVYVVTQHPISGGGAGSTSSSSSSTTSRNIFPHANHSSGGRKCVDENDSDCDEPENEGNEGDIENDDDGDDDDDANNNGDDDGEGDDDGDLENGYGDQVSGGGVKSSANKQNNGRKQIKNNINRLDNDDNFGSEFGSGSGPLNGVGGAGTGGPGATDDDEGGNDDSPDEETSTVYKIQPPLNAPKNDQQQQTTATTTPNKSTLTTTTMPTNQNQISTPATSTQGANIEVVVHSTLPPSFPMLTSAPEAGIGGSGSADQQAPGQEDGSATTSADSSSPTSTTTLMPAILPDDTYKAKPVYPSSTDKPEGTGNNGDDDSDPMQSGSAFKQLKDEDLNDLNTFKPMPMNPPTQAPMLMGGSGGAGNPISSPLTTPPSSQASAASSGQSANRLANPGVPPRYLWSTSRPQQQSGLFVTTLNPWASKGSAAGHSDYYSSTPIPLQQQSSMSPIKPLFLPQPSINTTSSLDLSMTIVLWTIFGSFTIVALFLALMTFKIYRRSRLRTRQLKAHAASAAAGQLGGGGAGPYMGGTMMPPSVSHGSHLVANMQQPGLLSTYAPGSKGMSALGKVTSSIVRSNKTDHDQLLLPEQQEIDDQQHHMMLMGNGLANIEAFNQNAMDGGQDEQQSSLNSKLDLNSIGDPPVNQNNNMINAQQNPGQQFPAVNDIGNNLSQTPLRAGEGGTTNNMMQQQNNNSWTTTTDDRSGTTTTTTESSTNSSVSQESKIMIMDQQQQQQQQQQQSPQQMMQQQQQHPVINVMQNPLQMRHQPNNNNMNIMQQNQQPYQPQQQQPLGAGGAPHNNQQNRMIQFASNHGGWSSGSDGHQHSSSLSDSQDSQNEMNNTNNPFPAPNFQQPPPMPRPPIMSNNNIGHHQTGQLIYQPSRAMINPNNMMMQNSRSVEDLQREQMLLMNGVGSGTGRVNFPAHINGQPTPFKQAYQQANGAGRVGLINGLNHDRLMQTPNLSNGFGNPTMPQQQPDFGGPINPAHVAMNPLATLTRRYPGLGLTRNILSEDTSSSIVTASPSLARTLSSSSSFALNQRAMMNQFAPSPLDSSSIATNGTSQFRPKPLIDASGRLMNDYTPSSRSSDQQMAFNPGGISGGDMMPPAARPPIVPGRNNRSEAWYV